MIRAHTAALVVCLLSLRCFAYELKRDSTGTAVSWKHAVEFVLDQGIGEDLGVDDVVAAANAAMNGVRTVASVPVSMRAGAATGVGFDFAAGANNRSEIMAVKDWQWDDRAIAVTIVTVDAKSHAIIDADIAFNARGRKFAVLPTNSVAQPNSEYDDVQNTLTHELGHAVGLSHNPGAPEAAMYPAAKRGEVTKRTLAADDVAGLLQLYGNSRIEGSTAASESAEEQAAGCAAVPGLSGWLPLLGALAMLLRRRGLAVALGSALAAPAMASETRVAPVVEASSVAQAEVVSRTTLSPARGTQLLTTEVRVKTTRCLKGECPEEWVLLLPGGRFGDIEQSVEGLVVPEVGEQVGFTVAPGERTMRPGPSRVRLFRLRLGQDLVAFLTGVHRAQTASGSHGPQR